MITPADVEIGMFSITRFLWWSEKELSAYIGRLASQGIAFNYLLNSACLGNREWSRAWQNKLNLC